MLGYLFYIGDRTKTDLPYLETRRAVMNGIACAVEAEQRRGLECGWRKRLQDRYGFKDFLTRGGVLPGEQED